MLTFQHSQPHLMCQDGGFNFAWRSGNATCEGKRLRALPEVGQ